MTMTMHMRISQCALQFVCIACLQHSATSLELRLPATGTLQKACTRCCSSRSCSGLSPPSAPLLLLLGSLVLPLPFFPIASRHFTLMPGGSHIKWQSVNTTGDALDTQKREKQELGLLDNAAIQGCLKTKGILDTFSAKTPFQPKHKFLVPGLPSL